MAEQSPRSSTILFLFLGATIIVLSFCSGITGAYLGSNIFNNPNLANLGGVTINTSSASDIQSAYVKVAADASPSVVSIVISKDVSKYEDLYSNPYYDLDPEAEPIEPDLQQVGAGTGFIISSEGLIVTNRHVVSDSTATYTVILNDGTKLDAEVIGRDTIIDIAVLKVTTDIELNALVLGDSDQVKIGQLAIAIGNSLGQFSNTVSGGIISGLSRSIVASDDYGLNANRLEGVIQTDASINRGNSGGPLLDIDGRVIGVNVAIAANAQNIGFAIPINSVKVVIDSVNEFGEIVRPYVGVNYLPVDEELVESEDLPVDYGAFVLEDTEDGTSGVLPDSPAEKAGVLGGDIIIELNGQKLDEDHQLQAEVQKYRVGDTVTLKIQRGEEQIELDVVLEKRPAE
jgi:serine protease Do